MIAFIFSAVEMKRYQYQLRGCWWSTG